MDYHCCPECGGNRIQQKRTAQTIGQVVGAIGGIAVGVNGNLNLTPLGPNSAI